MIVVKPRVWRISQCTRCWWRDFYSLLNSYPPRCPECGQDLEHDFAVQDRVLSADERRSFGRDAGTGRVTPRWPGVPHRRARSLGWA